MSAFLDLTADVCTELLAAPALAGGHVRRGRDVPVPLHVAQAIDVHAERAGGELTDLDGAAFAWDTLVGIDLYARATPGTDAETAIDALLTATFERLATAEPPAGVIAWVLAPTIQWSVDEADKTLVQASLVLRVQHHTDTGLEAI